MTVVAPLTVYEVAQLEAEHYDWHGAGHCATCVWLDPEDSWGEAGSAPFPCLPARLLATLRSVTPLQDEAGVA